MIWINVEQLVSDIIGSALNGEALWESYNNGEEVTLTVPVSTNIPNPRPNNSTFVRFILISGTNTVQRGFVETSYVDVEGWGTDSHQAWDVLMQVRQAMHDSINGDVVRRVVEDDKPSNFPTGEDNWERYRMQFAIDLSTRG